MRQDRTCKYCSILFPNEDGKVFANHVRWCDKNLTNGDKGASKCSQKNIERYIHELGELKEFIISCSKCQKEFVVKEREKQHPKKEVYFCSRPCANSRGPRTKDFKSKISMKLSGRTYSERITIFCAQCNEKFEVTLYNKNRKCCSIKCSKKYRYKDIDKSSLKYYRTCCVFKFNLADYPEEFDFSLIEEHGWYSAKNRGNNLNGVSRDHIVSVKYGYQNNIDPRIISHPANCRLMLHGSNVSKGEKCGMTLEQLKEKIEKWNEKYT